MGTIAVPFSYIHVGSSIYRRKTAADPRWTGERDCRGSEQFSAGVSGLVKKPLTVLYVLL